MAKIVNGEDAKKAVRALLTKKKNKSQYRFEKVISPLYDEVDEDLNEKAEWLLVVISQDPKVDGFYRVDPDSGEARRDSDR